MNDPGALLIPWGAGFLAGYLACIPVGPVNVTIINEGARRGFRHARERGAEGLRVDAGAQADQQLGLGCPRTCLHRMNLLRVLRLSSRMTSQGPRIAVVRHGIAGRVARKRGARRG